MYPLGVKILILWLVTSCSFALPKDKEEVLLLSAGSADINQQTHVGLYLKDVKLDQGTTHIRAARAETETDEKNQLIKAVIQGDKEAQAHYWTTTDPQKPPMHAFADTIYYYPTQHLIKLLGHARIEQGSDSFSGHDISYDTIHHHVISKNNGQGPTIIVIHPSKTS